MHMGSSGMCYEEKEIERCGLGSTFYSDGLVRTRLPGQLFGFRGLRRHSQPGDKGA